MKHGTWNMKQRNMEQWNMGHGTWDMGQFNHSHLKP